MLVAAGGAGRVAAVTVNIFWIAAHRVEAIGANELAVAEAGVGHAPAFISAPGIGVGVGVAVAVSGGKGGMLRVDAGVNDADDHAFAAGGYAGAGGAVPDVGRADVQRANLGGQLAQGIAVNGRYPVHLSNLQRLFMADARRQTVECRRVVEHDFYRTAKSLLHSGRKLRLLLQQVLGVGQRRRRLPIQTTTTGHLRAGGG